MHSYILLDRSGSMGTRWDDAIRSVNSYAEGLKGEKGDFNLTVAVFDTHNGSSTFDVLRNGVNIANWTDLSSSEVYPRGSTPLFDAVGKLVTLARSQKPEKAVFVIMTDGEENASREYTRESARALLEQCDRESWQTVFLGADFNNIQQTQTLGRNYANTMTVNSANLASTMKSTARMASAYAATGASMNYSDADRQAAVAPVTTNITAAAGAPTAGTTISLVSSKSAVDNAGKLKVKQSV